QGTDRSRLQDRLRSPLFAHHRRSLRTFRHGRATCTATQEDSMSNMALRVGIAAAVAGVFVVMPASVRAEPKKTEVKATIERKLKETRFKKDVFSGTEFR